MKWTDPINPNRHVSVVPFPGPITYPEFRGRAADAKRQCRENAKAAILAWLWAVADDVDWLEDLDRYLEPDEELFDIWATRITGAEPAPVYLMAMALPNTWFKRVMLTLGKKGLVQ